MITRFRVQNYKALRDVTLDLTAIHVLIGPNDSGKTSILDALAALCRSVDHQLGQAFTGTWDGPSLVWRGELDLPISLAATVQQRDIDFEYRLACRFPSAGRDVRVHEESIKSASEPVEFQQPTLPYSRVCGLAVYSNLAEWDLCKALLAVHDALVGVHYYRWNPRLLALPTAPDSSLCFRMEPDGFGLALCLDDILGYDRDQFMRLESRFRDIFPQVKSIKLIAEPAYRAPTDDPQQIPMLSRADGKGVYLEFDSGQLVSAAQVSDGMLLVLAYLTVLYLPKPPRVVLVEEPENGIHPKHLQDVLSILRELVKEQAHSQVILTTHSPYVVDLFQPDEVTLCQQEQDGSVTVRRLSESETVQEQLKVFTLGEIWTGEGDEALGHAPASREEPEQ